MLQALDVHGDSLSTVSPAQMRTHAAAMERYVKIGLFQDTAGWYDMNQQSCRAGHAMQSSDLNADSLLTACRKCCTDVLNYQDSLTGMC